MTNKQVMTIHGVHWLLNTVPGAKGKEMESITSLPAKNDTVVADIKSVVRLSSVVAICRNVDSLNVRE